MGVNLKYSSTPSAAPLSTDADYFCTIHYHTHNDNRTSNNKNHTMGTKSLNTQP